MSQHHFVALSICAPFEVLHPLHLLDQWPCGYLPMVFCILQTPKGKELLLKDKTSASFFKDNRADASNMEALLESLNRIERPKVFICGKEDKLLPHEVLEKDAQLGKFEIFKVENASHFVTFDQPESVAWLIENKLLRPQGE
jgi:pimeloyl-ACP methyl ester carboxylesterase